MTAEQARSVSSAIVEVGSHALTHPSLPALSAAQKRHEIRDSIERCQSLTGRQPRTFAYPFGDYDEESRTLVEECRFACACTTERRPVDQRDRLSTLPRVGMGNWDIVLTSRVLVEI
jgi:peptidoglycan/xylan/chitin deacetylase (PgdA/CDA1 family)